jgi:hypothetical protein
LRDERTKGAYTQERWMRWDEFETVEMNAKMAVQARTQTGLEMK